MKAFGALIFVVTLEVPYASGVWDDYGVISFSLGIVTPLPFSGVTLFPSLRQINNQV
jgi:hypothetical protein